MTDMRKLLESVNKLYENDNEKVIGAYLLSMADGKTFDYLSFSGTPATDGIVTFSFKGQFDGKAMYNSVSPSAPETRYTPAEYDEVSSDVEFYVEGEMTLRYDGDEGYYYWDGTYTVNDHAFPIEELEVDGQRWLTPGKALQRLPEYIKSFVLESLEDNPDRWTSHPDY